MLPILANSTGSSLLAPEHTVAHYQEGPGKYIRDLINPAWRNMIRYNLNLNGGGWLGFFETSS